MHWTHRHSRDFAIHIGRFAAGESHSEPVPRLRPDERPPPRGTRIRARQVTLATAGTFRVDLPNGKTLTMGAGEGGYDVYQVGTLRITCVSAAGEWLCLAPRALDRWWTREVIPLAAGETLALPRSRSLRNVYVATGQVRVGDATHQAQTMIRVAPRRYGTIAAITPALLVRLTARGAASLAPQPDPGIVA